MSANRKRLTETTVANLPTKPKSYRAWDKTMRGMFVLVQPTGTRSYHVLYRFKGSPKEHTLSLGRVGEITLEEARLKALEVRKAAARGDDPKARDAIEETDSFKACVERWTHNEQIGRKLRVSAEPTKAFLLTNCKRWHNRPISSLRYSEIDDLLCEIRDGSKRRTKTPYSANRIYAHLKTMFRWAVRTKRLATSPMAEMPKPWLGEKARERTWFQGELADAAIVKLWQVASQLGGDRGKFLKLLLITGKRRRAVETMRWEHISSAWYWRPPIGSKTKRCHAIVLPKLAQRLLSPRGDKGRVLEPIRPDAIASEVRQLTGIDDFILHGLRHVVATKLKDLKVSPHVARELLDHVAFNDEHAGYEHTDYREEMRDALELWCAHLERLVQPSDQVSVLR